jgi:hypothetical protein
MNTRWLPDEEVSGINYRGYHHGYHRTISLSNLKYWKKHDICVGLRYSETVVLRDDDFAERRAELVVVAEVVVEGFVRYNAAIWAAQQVPILRCMVDNA